MPAHEDEEHVDAEMADATDGLTVAAKKKKNKKKKKGGGGGDGGGEEAGAEEAGAEEAGTASAAAGDGADGADADGADGEGGSEMSAAKKKREKKKASDARKKAAAAEGGAEGGAADEVDDGTPWSSEIRGIKPWGAYPKCEKGGKQQTLACTVPVLQQFPSGRMPIGEEVAYIYDANSARARIRPEELRERERLHSISYDEVRTAAECHRQVRNHMQSVIRPGILMEDMCTQLEDLNRRLVQENGLKAGIAFPTGCSLNHVAAHWTPNSGDKTVLQYDDVCKIDFGTRVDPNR